jgi:hypothetical protein
MYLQTMSNILVDIKNKIDKYSIIYMSYSSVTMLYRFVLEEFFNGFVFMYLEFMI